MRYKTPVVAKMLGVTYVVLFNMLRYGHMDPPLKDSSGHLVWGEQDIERAREVLARRRRRASQKEGALSA
jgi:hypothetical protein